MERIVWFLILASLQIHVIIGGVLERERRPYHMDNSRIYKGEDKVGVPLSKHHQDALIFNARNNKPRSAADLKLNTILHPQPLPTFPRSPSSVALRGSPPQMRTTSGPSSRWNSEAMIQFRQFLNEMTYIQVTPIENPNIFNNTQEKRVHDFAWGQLNTNFQSHITKFLNSRKERYIASKGGSIKKIYLDDNTKKQYIDEWIKLPAPQKKELLHYFVLRKRLIESIKKRKAMEQYLAYRRANLPKPLNSSTKVPNQMRSKPLLLMAPPLSTAALLKDLQSNRSSREIVREKPLAVKQLLKENVIDAKTRAFIEVAIKMANGETLAKAVSDVYQTSDVQKPLLLNIAINLNERNLYEAFNDGMTAAGISVTSDVASSIRMNGTLEDKEILELEKIGVWREMVQHATGLMEDIWNGREEKEVSEERIKQAALDLIKRTIAEPYAQYVSRLIPMDSQKPASVVPPIPSSPTKSPALGAHSIPSPPTSPLNSKTSTSK